MSGLVQALARRRWLATGLAVAVELALLVPLARASPSTAVGIPAAVAAAIGGTVAVVFGPLAGIGVALVGAVTFGALEGWGTGQLLALFVWPAIVGAAGLVGRTIQRQRRALADLDETRERERQRLALELHDQTAQAIAAALFALRRAEDAESGEDAGAARSDAQEILRQAIDELRALAVDLRPRVLDDFGLRPALGRLELAGEPVTVRGDVPRLAPELETIGYRAVEDVVQMLEAGGAPAPSAVVELGCEGATVRLGVTWAPPAPLAVGAGLETLRERVRAAGGRLASAAGAVRIELPFRPAGAAVARAGTPPSADGATPAR